MKGIFSISLDMELHWGGFEKWPLETYRTYFLNTRRVIPEILHLFRKYEVHVTWAAVGMLLHTSRKELMENVPRSEEHTSELQSHSDLVCRLLLEKKKKKRKMKSQYMY